jgi:beta-glucosidase
LQKILRQEWGFGGPDGLEGYVVSDCWAINDIYAHHKVVDTAEEVAVLAVQNGCELNCGSTYPVLVGAVEQGLISEASIDQAVQRLFVARHRLGLFDPSEQVPYADIPYEVVDSAEHRALALRAAQESMVLLKNDGGTLPLKKDIGAIAVVGPNADHLQVLIGNYSGTPARAVTPLEGIRKKLPAGARVYHAIGCEWTDGVPPMVPIPALHLRPAEADAGDNGLTAAHYDNADFEGEPRLTRTDPGVDFIWKATTPLAGQWGDHFSVCWSGFLVPPASGIYRLGVDGLSGYKLHLDGELLVEYADIHHPVLRAREVALEGGRLYPLRLEFFSRGLDPQARLLWARPDVDYEAPALEAAARADVVVAVMGLSPRLEGEEMPVHVEGFEGGDRTDIALPRPQVELLKKLQALDKPVVLALLNGSALALPWVADNIPAIIEAWYPGQAGGDALADVLFGDYNPGGRLPITFYQSVDDLPPFEDYAMAGRTYRYFQGEPLYPFGYGLSYTSFAHSDLSIGPREARAGEHVDISLTVTNTGSAAGDEVVQLYVRGECASVPRPLKELKGYARIALQPGESKRITFQLPVDQLAFFDDNQDLVLEPGSIAVMLGSSSADIRLIGEFEIAGTAPIAPTERVFFCAVDIG